MKILFYNWTQFDKQNNNGGGVNVYQKNVIDYLASNTNYDLFFLSSGVCYNPIRRKPYIRESNNMFASRCHSYILWNSPVLAPMEATIRDLESYIYDKNSYALLKTFINDYGPFDVIHFNNLEGLSINCLKIKEDFPNIKVIYSLHNYIPFCPNGNLFYNNECNCIDNDDCSKCELCLGGYMSSSLYKCFYAMDSVCEEIGKPNLSKQIQQIGMKLRGHNFNFSNSDKQDMHISNDLYKVYREKNVCYINKYVDNVLAVSERVKEIAIQQGIDRDKVITSYIGTKVAENAKYVLNNAVKDKLNVIYMGYFVKQKGFDFLINALEQLPDDYAKKINFYCYAKIKADEDAEYVRRIQELNEKFNFAKHFDGYIHDDLPTILNDMNLGVVPVVWEDNLPQIAIEFASFGVPVFASDLGGASELSNSSYFKFANSDYSDFTRKLEAIIDDTSLLNDYFDKMNKLTTMKNHMDFLVEIYKN